MKNNSPVISLRWIQFLNTAARNVNEKHQTVLRSSQPQRRLTQSHSRFSLKICSSPLNCTSLDHGDLFSYNQSSVLPSFGEFGEEWGLNITTWWMNVIFIRNCHFHDIGWVYDWIWIKCIVLRLTSDVKWLNWCRHSVIIPAVGLLYLIKLHPHTQAVSVEQLHHLLDESDMRAVHHEH